MNHNDCLQVHVTLTPSCS